MATYIGTATSRIDGRAKVTGEAKYAGEFNVPGLAYGYVVESTIPRGRITRIDATAALQVGGVIDVLTHTHRPWMADSDDAYKDGTAPEQGSPYRPLYDDKVQFSGQPIALVVAEDWETAKFAASRLTVEYQQEAHVTDLHAQRGKAFVVDKPKKPRGDADRAFAAAGVRHKGEYFIPTEHHNPMELFASTAIWEDDGKLTVYDKTQGVQNVQQYLCGVFGMQADRVRVLSPYMGGGFGSGLRPQYQVVLAVLAAHALKRPVRVVLSRQQMYALGHRPATIERLALGARADGTLEAITHEAIAVTSQYEEFSRNDTGWGDLLYTSPNAKFVHRLARLDVPTPCDMRAPGAATGVYALEMRDGRTRRRAQDRSDAAAPAVLFRPRSGRRTSLYQQAVA
jgi:xanthine dehydrogenase YagR molybdenum-binding subunit